MALSNYPLLVNSTTALFQIRLNQHKSSCQHMTVILVRQCQPVFPPLIPTHATSANMLVHEQARSSEGHV
jgi:hypothetical protein